jgi:hypothetical protein
MTLWRVVTRYALPYTPYYRVLDGLVFFIYKVGSAGLKLPRGGPLYSLNSERPGHGGYRISLRVELRAGFLFYTSAQNFRGVTCGKALTWIAMGIESARDF